MKRMTQRQQRQALYGWIKWLPVIAFAFAPLFFDAWLNIQTWRNDYVISKLNRQVRQFRADLDGMRVQEAKLETLERLALAADELQLREPDPNQKQTLAYASSEQQTLAAAEPLTLASNLDANHNPVLQGLLPSWLETGVQSAQNHLITASEIMFRNDRAPVPAMAASETETPVEPVAPAEAPTAKPAEVQQVQAVPVSVPVSGEGIEDLVESL